MELTGFFGWFMQVQERRKSCFMRTAPALDFDYEVFCTGYKAEVDTKLLHWYLCRAIQILPILPFTGEQEEDKSDWPRILVYLPCKQNGLVSRTDFEI